jgi:DNA (cytosine-5)-methyltransferase 1
VDGIPGGMAQIHAFGNAIVPQVAAEFIAAYRECRP